MKTTKKWSKMLLAGMAAMVLAFCLMVTGCATNWWNEAHPESETAALFFYDGKIVGYNDVAFEKPTNVGWVYAGEATVVVDMTLILGNRIRTTYKAEGMEFDFSFEAGKKYAIMAVGKHIYDDEEDVWGVKIYDGVPSIGYPKEENLIAFVPFNHQPVFVEK